MIDLIDGYVDEWCKGEPAKIGLPELTLYINQHGFPDYKVTSLRRDQFARDYIESIKPGISKREAEITVAAFKSLDPANFLEVNHSNADIIRALTDWNAYYMKVAESAALFLDEKKRYEKKIESLQKEFQNQQEENRQLTEKLKNAKKALRASDKRMEIYRSVVDTYVYPGIADKLLEKQHLIHGDKNGDICDEVLDEEILHADSLLVVENEEEDGPDESEATAPAEQELESDIIQGLFSDFE